MNRNALWTGLQVEENQIYGYRSGIMSYELTADTPAAYGRAMANMDLGGGGLGQYYIDANKKASMRAIAYVSLE